MQSLWLKIEIWLSHHFPGGLSNLGNPATESEIETLEQSLQQELPEELKQLLCLHNGESPNEIWLLGDWSLLPIKYIIEAWTDEMKMLEKLEPDLFTKQCLWNPRWIPFAYDGSGGYLCIDLDPSDKGFLGQVIQTSSDGFCKRVSNNLSEFFELFIKNLYDNSFDLVEGRLEPNKEWWK
ncbi:MAG: SMI1/KNR4 family protein [Pirellulales bacterium]|jgi:cell wall assembly regulator SMI1